MVRGNSRREGVFDRRSPTKYKNETTIECNGTPTEDWLRRQAIATIKRPLLQPDLEKTYALDKDYRGDHRHCTELPAQLSLTPKLQPTAIPVDQNDNALHDHLLSQLPKEDTHGSTNKPIFPGDFPAALNSIEEYITEKDGYLCIPFHSTIVLKKRRRMLYLPLEFGEITMDGLVYSGAFINVMV